MPIEFECPNCKSVLRVADETAGKRARCPQCQVINDIPGDPVEDVTLPPSSSMGIPRSETTGSVDQYYIDSVSGQSYGPVNKLQLDDWVSQGRVSKDCRIRCSGGETVPSTELYPDLGNSTSVSGDFPTSAKSSTAHSVDFSSQQKRNAEFENRKVTLDNPYASPHPFAPSNGIPEVPIGSVFEAAWTVYTRNLPLLVGTSAIIFVIELLSEWLVGGEVSSGGEFIVSMIMTLFQVFLAIGQAKICLKLSRNQKADIGDLFSGGHLFLPIVGYSIITFIAVTIGLLLLIVPGILLMLIFWPSYFFVVDEKCGVMDSFSNTYEYGNRNKLNSLVLAIASFGISILGLFLFCIGYIFAIGFVSVLWAMAYLMMTNQLKS